METIKNAKIEGTTLGYESHGILTCNITLDYGGSCQGFGGYKLGGDYTTEVIEGILKAVGVESWEELAGKHVRVKRGEGYHGKVLAIGNFLEDKWFSFDKK